MSTTDHRNRPRGNRRARPGRGAVATTASVIAEETSAANLRWAGNTLTTNGVSRSRRLTVIAIDRRGDGAAAGVVSRSGVRPDQIEDVGTRGGARGRRGRSRRGRGRAHPGGTAGLVREKKRAIAIGRRLGLKMETRLGPPLGHTEIGVLRDFAAGARRDAARRRGGRAQAVRVRRARADQHVPRHVGRAAAAARPADRAGGAEREVRRHGAARPGRAWRPATSPTWTSPAWTPGWPSGSAGPSAPSRCRPGGTRRCCRPLPSSDLLTYLYWSAGAQGRGGRADGVQQARRRYAARRAAVAGCPVTLSSDPLAPGLGCAPFVIAHASGPDSSVFDNGLPLRRDLVDPGRLAGGPGLLPALGRGGRGAGHARHRQPDLRHLRRRGADAGAR